MPENRIKGPSLEDRIAIDDLYSEYLWALDTGDTEGWLAAFAADAEVWETQKDGTVWRGRGRDELLQLIGKYHGNPDFPGHQHRESARLFEPDPEGRPDHWAAKSYTSATNFDVASHSATLYWAGYYRDIVGRVDGEWKLVKRWIAPWMGDVLSRFEDAR